MSDRAVRGDDVAYAPLDQHTQPRGVIEGYTNTSTRWPSQTPYPLTPGMAELTGPMLYSRWTHDGDNNLVTSAHGGEQRAMGQLIEVSGYVLDEHERAVRHGFIEIWQANAAGKYAHPNDATNNPLDHNFRGYGRTVTDETGHYRFLTIKPGAYPTPESGNWWRPPHIHFSLFGESNLQRLVTQMYFPGEPLNVYDRILNSIPAPEARERLTATLDRCADGDDAFLRFKQDFVVRGRHETPFENRRP